MLRRFDLLAVLALAGSLFVAPPARADIPNSDFPPKGTVKTELHGTGTWTDWTGPLEETLGSRPRGCRSDKQMLEFTEAGERTYFGRERGFERGTIANAEVAIFYYDTAAQARAAVRKNRSYPSRCPEVTEWVCEDCDGISTTWRVRVSARRVGDQSAAWRYRRESNTRERGYTIVAREGSTVVRVEVGRLRDPFHRPFNFPPLRKLSDAVRVARIAIQDATD